MATHGLSRGIVRSVWVNNAYRYYYFPLLPPLAGPMRDGQINPKMGTVGVSKRRRDDRRQYNPLSYARSHNNKVQHRPDPFYGQEYETKVLKFLLIVV